MANENKLSRESFELLVEKALAALPEEFHVFLENVVVIVEDEPPAETPDILGLYEGVPLVERSMDDTLLPDRITLFKRSIEGICHTPAEIEAEVSITVLHEIGHFFGLSEKQLEHLELRLENERGEK